MNEMLERVARALCRQYQIDDGFSPEQADRAAAGEMYRNFLAAARATIAAMREPTEAMDAAARAECFRMAGCLDPVMHIWDVMIDKALK